MSPLLLTPGQARERLGVSERGLRDLVQRGLPFIIVGRRKMFPGNDIANWISEQTKICISSTSARVRRPGTSHSRSTGIAFDEALARTIRT